ncbi:MAG TPA: peptide chain release factor N(5)-glutamine methyltransferase [Gemmatimonadaceae bacterium]|nr:peptide chain release factor N(5)-glutamine methyltransferase [Gemmatimonadaceae bacterium]
MPDATMTGRSVRDVMASVAELLSGAGIPEPRAEARDIVAAVLDMPRLWPSLHADEPLDERARADAVRAARHRAAGAPFAYAVGRAAFRHLTLDVDERVLIPRQETEQLVEAVLELGGDWDGIAVDLGTGSGAIALSLASEARFTRVVATDVSEGALTVARDNAVRLAAALNTPVEFRQGSLLAPLGPERVRVIVSNPPYVSHDEAAELPAGVRDWEPPVALFSGGSGMDATAAIIRGAAAHLEPRGLLALEVDARRAALAAELALACGFYEDVSVRLDLAGRERILLARRIER